MKEDFEKWLFCMDNILEEFVSYFKELTGGNLDYSIGSLNVLEKWMLDRFISHEELQDKKNKMLQDQITRYIGEIFRKNLKCKWSIKFDDPKFVFYGLPILIEKETGNTIVCPHTLSTTAIMRRQNDFLSKIYEKVREVIKV